MGTTGCSPARRSSASSPTRAGSSGAWPRSPRPRSSSPCAAHGSGGPRRRAAERPRGLPRAVSSGGPHRLMRPTCTAASRTYSGVGLPRLLVIHSVNKGLRGVAGRRGARARCPDLRVKEPQHGKQHCSAEHTTGPTPPDDDVAQRLLDSAAVLAYDPATEVDWETPLDKDFHGASPEWSTLYGTAYWGELTEAQRKELTRQEAASVASTGIWFEMILQQMVLRDIYAKDPTSAEVPVGAHRDRRGVPPLDHVRPRRPEAGSARRTGRTGASSNSAAPSRRSPSARRRTRRSWWPKRSSTSCSATGCGTSGSCRSSAPSTTSMSSRSPGT